jgi:predicted DNA-binding transcriptional regulator AlpA
MSLPEVLRLTKRSRAELDRLSAARQFPEPALGPGGELVYRAHQVRKWLASHARQSAPVNAQHVGSDGSPDTLLDARRTPQNASQGGQDGHKGVIFKHLSADYRAANAVHAFLPPTGFKNRPDPIPNRNLNMPAKYQPPKPPDDLAPATAAWFSEVADKYILESHHLKLLTLAGRAWDRANQAREVIDREGLTYVDRFNAPRLRPEVKVEQQARIDFARLLRELSLDVEPPPEARKPRRPGTGS